MAFFVPELFGYMWVTLSLVRRSCSYSFLNLNGFSWFSFLKEFDFAHFVVENQLYRFHLSGYP